MTIEQWLRAVSLSPNQAADLLFFTPHPRTSLDAVSFVRTHGDIELTKHQVVRLHRLAKRLIQGEPLQYILGKTIFHNLDLKTDKRALIPRQETEELVDLVITYVESLRHQSSVIHPLTIADIGTGCGAIAMALAHWLIRAKIPSRIIASDISEDALELAQENFKNLKIEIKNSSLQLDFHHGSLLQLITEPVDIIVANLPYIPTHWVDLLETGVKDHEPRAALDGGPDGFTLIRELLKDAPRILKPDGKIFLEMWHEHSAKDFTEFDQLYQIEIRHDSFDKTRFAICTRR